MLLNTVNLANALAVHSLNELAVYQDGTVSLYKKNDVKNDLDLLQTYTLADVKRLAISDNGKNLCAQTGTQTHRLTENGAEPLNVTGRIAISDSNYLLVLLTNAVQIVRETTVNLTAALGIRDKVACGINAFVIYGPTRYLKGTYTGVTLTPTTPAKTISSVTHIGSDNFAIFYTDGYVELSGTTRTSTVLNGHRDCGKHVIANDGTDDWAYMKGRPLTQPVKLRPYVPVADDVSSFNVFNADGTLHPAFMNVGATVSANSITVAQNQYLTMPTDPGMAPRTQDFSIEYEVQLVSVPATVAGSTLQTIFYWGTWANPSQPVNMESFYAHAAEPYLFFSISHNGTQYSSAALTLTLGQWYNIKWVRKSGMLALYVDDVQINNVPFAFDITYDTAQPFVIGRRRGGSSGEVVWFSSFKLRKLNIKIG